MKILGVIPTRYASTRFPGKPLTDIGGKSMIQRVYEQSIKASVLSKIVIATDDERIFRHAENFSDVIMTRPDHPSGTDRCLEALEQQQDAFDYVINIQGDEPFIDPIQIETLATELKKSASIATLAKPIETETTLNNPNIVKVISQQPIGQTIKCNTAHVYQIATYTKVPGTLHNISYKIFCCCLSRRCNIFKFNAGHEARI